MEVWKIKLLTILGIMVAIMVSEELAKIIKNNIIKDSKVSYIDGVINKSILNCKYYYLTDFIEAIIIFQLASTC